MITSHPNTTMAKKGHMKELNCTARGEWPIIIRWERGDTVIDPDRNPRYSITTSPNEKTDEVLSTLKVGGTEAFCFFFCSGLYPGFFKCACFVIQLFWHNVQKVTCRPGELEDSLIKLSL